jgi:hypothetical protein
MKKLLALAVLALPSLGWGANSSLTVSSGTFLAVDGFTPANTNFRQAITIADPNATAGVASVDPITGLTVHLASSTVSIGNVNIISTQPFTVISTGVVTQAVTGTFFQANQPVNFNNIAQPILITSGTVNIISTQPFTVISTGVVTQAVTGTFFQTTQPIQGTVNIISTQPVTVYGTTTAVVNTTITVQNIQQALPAGSNSLGNVNITSTNTLAISGSLSVVALSTGQINTATPQVANYDGFVNASGLMQAARVNTSSDVFVYLDNPTTTTITGIVPVVLTSTPPIQVFGSTIAITNVSGQNLNVAGSLSVVALSTGQINTATPQVASYTGFTNGSGLMQAGRVDTSSSVFVNVNEVGGTAATVNGDGGINVHTTNGAAGGTSSNYNSAFPGAGTAAGFVSPTGTMQAGSVTLSSQTITYQANPSTVTFNGVTQPIVIIGTPPVQMFGSTIAVSGIQGIVQTVITSTPPVQVFGSTIAVSNIQSIVQAVLTSTPPVTVIQSTVGAVGMYADNGVSSATNRVTTLDGVYQNGTSAIVAGSQGKDAAITIGTDHMAWVTPQPAILPYSYTASTNSFSIATSTNDAMAICGNAQHIVEVYGIRASCTQTTAGIIQIGIVKRSSAYSGVWSTASVVAESSNYTGSRSTATFFTSANLVVGTLVGYLDSYKLGCMATGTATPNDIYISPADWRMKPIILNSASECVAINLNGATITGGTMSATFDFEESYPTGYNPQ